ncbi:glycosyltransferase, partial [Mycobacterium tuberculosis]|nr:glycosyltransferase [Mycobacterium tuberculosis]
GAAVAFLPPDAPVAELLAEAHILLLPSENEGLALVAFEAARADCLVISTDVGAQREIVAPACLVPRGTWACWRESVRLVTAI